MAKEALKTIHENEFSTPCWLFNALNLEFDFKVDLACTSENMLCEKGFSSPEFDSLEMPWHKEAGWLWLNPPYSPLKPWIQKCQKEFLLGAKIVLLCPPIISTRYFSQQVPSEIRFILGRVNFLIGGKEMKSNTSDSMIAIWGPPVMPKITYIDRDKLRKQGA